MFIGLHSQDSDRALQVGTFQSFESNCQRGQSTRSLVFDVEGFRDQEGGFILHAS